MSLIYWLTILGTSVLCVSDSKVNDFIVIVVCYFFLFVCVIVYKGYNSIIVNIN